MPNPEVRRGFLLHLAAEGMVPVLGGCAGALVGGPEGGLAGVAVGQVVEKAINFFGGRIVQRWCEWFRAQPAEARQAALADLAALSPQEAREEAAAALDRLAPDASPEDRSVALEYLSIIPGALDRALPPGPDGVGRSLPPTATFDEPQLLLQFLPADVPPYPVPSDLPGTPYRLQQLLGSGGFGAVYRATTHSLQHLPLAVKFCLDPALTAALHRERSNLERLMKAGGEGWTARIVRLYGYDLGHRTPYLVYEFVPGGDLTRYLAQLRDRLGRPLNADEVLGLVIQVAEALAFAHRHGLVHRDLKPANILVDGDTLKLADFGLGGLAAARAAQVSRIGTTTMDYLSLADQASLFRGAGTPLYMAPEQRRGAAPDPRHDLYSLGVMWYQLLAGDVSRELHPGWAKELAVRFRVPAAHLALIERCVGWLDERPKDAAELLPLLRDLQARQAAPPAVLLADGVAVTVAPAPAPGGESDRLRQSLLQSLVQRVEEGHRLLALLERKKSRPLVGTLVLGVPLLFLVAAFFGAGTWLMVAVSVPLVAGLVALLYGLHQSQVKGVQRQIQIALRTLNDEFPDAVRSWGGPAALASPDTVREITRSLVPARSGPQPGPASVPAAEQGRDGSLAEGLGQIAQDHAELAGFARPRRVPWPLALVLSLLLLGGPLGVAAGVAYQRYFGPWENPWPKSGTSGTSKEGRGASTQVPQFFDYDGNPMLPQDYAVEARRSLAVAGVVGLGTGLLLTVFSTWLLTRRPLYPGPAALAFAVCLLLLGLPAGVGAGLLCQELLRPIYANGQHYDARGNELASHLVGLKMRQAEGVAIPAALAVGALLTHGPAWLYLWGYRRRHAQARRRLAGHVRELAAAFPATVEGWGGARALENPEGVQNLLRTVRPAAP